jgi:tol-pal system protein YbgF
MVNIMKKFILIGLLSISSVAFTAKDISIQDRIYKLEQMMAGSENGADLVIELQKIQQHVAELQGRIEEQQYQIKTITEKQKLLYIDIDSRLTELESKGSTTSSNSKIDTTKQNSELASESKTTPDSNSTLESQPIVESPSNNIEAAQNDYDVAFSHLRAGRFNESARLFESFIQMYPENDLIDNAYYWLGESFYVKRQYPQALSAFQTLVKQYPQSRKTSDSILKIGYTYYELGDIDNANKNLLEVVKNFPNTSVSRLAQNRLNQIKRGQ